MNGDPDARTRRPSHCVSSPMPPTPRTHPAGIHRDQESVALLLPRKGDGNQIKSTFFKIEMSLRRRKSGRMIRIPWSPLPLQLKGDPTECAIEGWIDPDFLKKPLEEMLWNLVWLRIGKSAGEGKGGAFANC